MSAAQSKSESGHSISLSDWFLIISQQFANSEWPKAKGRSCTPELQHASCGRPAHPGGMLAARCCPIRLSLSTRERLRCVEVSAEIKVTEARLKMAKKKPK